MCWRARYGACRWQHIEPVHCECGGRKVGRIENSRLFCRVRGQRGYQGRAGHAQAQGRASACARGRAAILSGLAIDVQTEISSRCAFATVRRAGSFFFLRTSCAGASCAGRLRVPLTPPLWVRFRSRAPHPALSLAGQFLPTAAFSCGIVLLVCNPIQETCT